jgi:hypothetical protein
VLHSDPATTEWLPDRPKSSAMWKLSCAIVAMPVLRTMPRIRSIASATFCICWSVRLDHPQDRLVGRRAAVAAQLLVLRHRDHVAEGRELERDPLTGRPLADLDLGVERTEPGDVEQTGRALDEPGDDALHGPVRQPPREGALARLVVLEGRAGVAGERGWGR